MQTELTQTGLLLDADGCLAQVGWSRQPLLDCNLTQQIVRETGLVSGWVDYKICAIDQT